MPERLDLRYANLAAAVADKPGGDRLDDLGVGQSVDDGDHRAEVDDARGVRSGWHRRAQSGALVAELAQFKLQVNYVDAVMRQLERTQHACGIPRGSQAHRILQRRLAWPLRRGLRTLLARPGAGWASQSVSAAARSGGRATPAPRARGRRCPDCHRGRSPCTTAARRPGGRRRARRPRRRRSGLSGISTDSTLSTFLSPFLYC